MTLAEFAALVERMRAEQKAFFGGDRSATRVATAKRVERQVDEAIRQIKAGPGLFDTEPDERKISEKDRLIAVLGRYFGPNGLFDRGEESAIGLRDGGRKYRVNINLNVETMTPDGMLIYDGNARVIENILKGKNS